MLFEGCFGELQVPCNCLFDVFLPHADVFEDWGKGVVSNRCDEGLPACLPACLTPSGKSDVLISIEEDLEIDEVSDILLSEDECAFDDDDVSCAV